MSETIKYKGQEYEVISEGPAAYDSTMRLLRLKLKEPPLYEAWIIIDRQGQVISICISLSEATEIFEDLKKGPSRPYRLVHMKEQR